MATAMTDLMSYALAEAIHLEVEAQPDNPKYTEPLTRGGKPVVPGTGRPRPDYTWTELRPELAPDPDNPPVPLPETPTRLAYPVGGWRDGWAEQEIAAAMAKHWRLQYVERLAHNWRRGVQETVSGNRLTQWVDEKSGAVLTPVGSGPTRATRGWAFASAGDVLQLADAALAQLVAQPGTELLVHWQGAGPSAIAAASLAASTQRVELRAGDAGTEASHVREGAAISVVPVGTVSTTGALVLSMLVAAGDRQTIHSDGDVESIDPPHEDPSDVDTFAVGGRIGPAVDFAQGRISEVMVFSEELTPAERADVAQRLHAEHDYVAAQLLSFGWRLSLPGIQASFRARGGVTITPDGLEVEGLFDSIPTNEKAVPAPPYELTTVPDKRPALAADGGMNFEPLGEKLLLGGPHLAANLSSTDPWSLIVRCAPGSTGEHCYAGAWSLSTSASIQLGRSKDKAYARIVDGSGVEQSIESGNVKGVTGLISVGCTYDGASMSVYVNGTKVIGGSIGMAGPDVPMDRFAIGGIPGEETDGEIFEVLVCNQALSEAELIEVHQNLRIDYPDDMRPIPAEPV